MPSLWFSDGHRELFKYHLKPGRNVIGRSEVCDIALPDDNVSRQHCVIERRAEGWWLIDRSRNGTQINGEPAERAILHDGDRIAVGHFELRYDADLTRIAPATTRPVTPRLHEALLGIDGGSVATVSAALRFTHGPLEGQVRILNQARTWLGGGDSDIVLDGLPRQAVAVRLTRGRAMLQPTTDVKPVLAGSPVSALVPILEHEEVRIGAHGFIVETEIHEMSEERDSFGAMVGRTAIMRRLFGVLSRVAVHDHPILLTGESGTGKELAAKAVHDEGSRAGGPFVAVNCAAMPDTLVESELFGHVAGAFTGAATAKEGAFQRAAGGTLFLDEIGELKLEAQAKLLRALESGEIQRVGASEPIFPDVRVIAATNRDLTEMVSEGTFRADLLFRLSVLAVHLPPLRERTLDVPILAQAIVAQNLPGAVLTESALLRLSGHSWPGNVRELRNVLTRAFVLGGPIIEPEDLSFAKATFVGPELLAAELPRNERHAIQTALQRTNGNKAQAARILGIPRSSLLYRMKKAGIA